MKYKARASAAAALENLAGKQLKDFPNQAVRRRSLLCLKRATLRPITAVLAHGVGQSPLQSS